MILMMITTGYSTFMMMMTMETVIRVASFISFISDVLGILDAHDEDWHGDLYPSTIIFIIPYSLLIYYKTNIIYISF